MAEQAALVWSSHWPAILAVAVATYLLRIAGYWVLGRFDLSPALRRGLEALPGSIFVAATLPLALREGVPGMVALVASMALMWFTGREALAMIGALALAALARAAGFS